MAKGNLISKFILNLFHTNRSPGINKKKLVCIVAIAKDEDRFIEEWALYHRLIGIDHIFVYDDDQPKTLATLLSKYSDFVTVINWQRTVRTGVKVLNQVSAYNHSLEHHILEFEWVLFLDIDEFLVFRNVDNVKVFLAGFKKTVSSISLNWHVFGHNGYFEDPSDFVTTALTKRMNLPSRNVKSFTKTDAIMIIHQHKCAIKYGISVDANKRLHTNEIYSGKTQRAHVNHYQCRSFETWMRRLTRGDVNFEASTSKDKESWRFSENSLLRQFVTTVAYNKNEIVDEYMIKFKTSIKALQEKKEKLAIK